MAIPVMSAYTSLFLIGMHVIQGVLGSLQLPAFAQTLSKDRPNGQKDRLFTLPSNVISVDDIKRHLKPKKLHKRLGKDFNPFWMSADIPDDLLETHVRHGLNAAVEEDLNTLNITTLENALQAKYDSSFGGGVSSNMTNSVLELVKYWLVQKASCPVYYIWEDLGPFYWPRWVRRGLCSVKDTPLFKLSSDAASRIPEHSHCSWPPGMHCVPAEAIQLKIFRWQCRNKKSLNNFNRFRLPGLEAPSTFPKRSKRHREMNETSKLTSNQHLHKQFHRKPLGAFSFPSNSTASLIHNTKQNRRNINTLEASSEIRNRKNKILSKTHVDSRKGKEMRGSEHQKLKGSTNTAHGNRQEEGNDTENWSSKKWKERRRAMALKCRWIKIPYPVIDDCFCSC